MKNHSKKNAHIFLKRRWEGFSLFSKRTLSDYTRLICFDDYHAAILKFAICNTKCRYNRNKCIKSVYAALTR